MQRLGQADAFVPHGQRQLQARQVQAKVEALEIRFLRRPGVLLHGAHGVFEKLFDVAALGAVEHLIAARGGAGAQPGGG